MLIEYIIYDSYNYYNIWFKYNEIGVDFIYKLDTNKLMNLSKSSPSVVLEYLNELGIKPINNGN